MFRHINTQRKCVIMHMMPSNAQVHLMQICFQSNDHNTTSHKPVICCISGVFNSLIMNAKDVYGTKYKSCMLDLHRIPTHRQNCAAVTEFLHRLWHVIASGRHSWSCSENTDSKWLGETRSSSGPIKLGMHCSKNLSRTQKTKMTSVTDLCICVCSDKKLIKNLITKLSFY